MLTTGNSEIAHHVQAVPATHRPARHHADDYLGHESNQALHFQNVEASGARRVDAAGIGAVGVLVAVLAANALVSTATKCPAPIFWRWAVAREQHTPNVGALASMVECGEQFINRLRAKCVTHLWPIERDAHGA